MKRSSHPYKMSSIGVVVFRNSLTNSQVLQESVNNSTNISNNDANKPRREIVIVRKKQKVQSPPATVSVTSLVRAAEAGGVAAKRPRVREETSEEVAKSPTPLAVARRNARERNRVRQVNDGFAALRKHIPVEVAEAFETANTSRGINKKLSKVETLRMAVEYIRNLESLLNIGHASDKENALRPSMESFPSPASSSPREGSFDRNYFSLNSPALEDDDLDDEFADTSHLDVSLPHLPQTQYVRVMNPDGFHMATTPHLYEDDDRGQALTPSSDLITHEDVAVSPHLLHGTFPFASSAEQFTVIDAENRYNCTDNDIRIVENVPEFEIKYAQTLQSQLSCSYPEDSQMAISEINIGLAQEDFKYKDKQSFVENEYNEIDLKKELPEIHVTPEDREQFEETLKWWQEKTRQSRPYVKNTSN